MKRIYLIIYEAFHNSSGLHLDQRFIVNIVSCLSLILSTQLHSTAKEQRGGVGKEKKR